MQGNLETHFLQAFSLFTSAVPKEHTGYSFSDTSGEALASLQALPCRQQMRVTPTFVLSSLVNFAHWYPSSSYINVSWASWKKGHPRISLWLMSSITIIVCTFVMPPMLTSMSLQAPLNFLISPETVFNASIRFVCTVNPALSVRDLVITFTSAPLSSITSTYVLLTLLALLV